MKHFKKFLQHHKMLIAILCIGLFLGLYQLNNLPAEMWGDATAHYALAQQARHGQLFFKYRYGGDGPIYTYIVVFVSLFLGLSFFTLKFTSVVIYLAFIVFMYLLSDELFKRKEITYTTAFLSAVSFWSLTFARQPHARMLAPLFVAATIFFAVKRKPIISGILLGLGMYTQASFWATPLVFWKRFKTLIIGLVLTIPLIVTFATGSTGFFTNQSYFGEKLAVTDSYTSSEVIKNLVSNISSNFFSFFLRGDEGFRLNVPASPHLDLASAIFFFIGFFLLIFISFKQKKMKYIEFIIFPFFFIQIPSLLDIHNPLAQPNIGRMIGIIPFIYMSTAYGLTTSLHAISKQFEKAKVRRIIYFSCLCYLLGVIAVANIYKYFVIYPYFLPDHNTPFARIIAQTIDRYPPNTIFFVIGSGWSEWGQPEQQAIIDSITVSHQISFSPLFSPLCNTLKTTSGAVVLITSPTDSNSLSEIQSCDKKVHPYLLQNNSFQIARIIEVNK